jgi:hypothetical protein
MSTNSLKLWLGLMPLSLFLFLGSAKLIFGQEIVYQGRVLEKANLKPVPGASVQLEGGTDLAVLTDAKGVFKISIKTSALHAVFFLQESSKLKPMPTVFSWHEKWTNITGRQLEDSRPIQGFYLEPTPSQASRAKTSASASSLKVTCTGLLAKSTTVDAASQDVGDIILDYPPRRLDIGAPPIYGSVVLFDGQRSTFDVTWEHWMGTYRKNNNLGPTPVVWLFVKDPVDTGMTMQTCCRAQWGDQDLVTKQKFRDYQLHVEFNLVKPRADAGIEPANSGVYLQSIYEIQIKDDYGVNPLGNHDAGGILNEFASPTNESRPKGQWQAYDITFRDARFKNGVCTEKARLTMYWNGKLVHLDRETANEHNVGISSETLLDEAKGLKLQSEGHDVRFRNIWLKELSLTLPNTNVGY